jgi:hypothetical protein
MIPYRHLQGSIRVQFNDPEERRLHFRRKRYERRMVLAGLRPASVQRYLARGFKGPFVRAMHTEMQRLVWDIKYRRAA